jgi:TonB family protein
MRVLQGILLSLFIHFFVVWSAQFAPKLAARLDQKPITVEIIDHNKSQNETEPKGQKQIVRQTLVPDQMKTEESEDPRTFLSAERQRVKKQMQAANTGMTQNRSGEKADANESKSQQNSKEEKPEKVRPKMDPRLSGGIAAFTPKYRKVPPRPAAKPSELDRGLSTIGEALPQDVSVGSFTALNTDRYLYYSFFSRIEEMIRFRWESLVREAIDTTPPERLTYNSSGIWVTKLEIWIKRNGEIDSIHVMKESGFKSFDRAATTAFQEARIFPNPPEEMVESDGIIHLKYSFQVRYEPKVLVKSRE